MIGRVTGFRSARELSAAFYADVIRPVVDVPHAAGLLGWGSDVLGYDTERSMDHGWGPRLQVFVDEPAGVRDAIEQALPATRTTGIRCGSGGTRRSRSTTSRSRRSATGLWTCSGLMPRLESAVRTGWSRRSRCCSASSPVPCTPTTGRLARIRSALQWYPDEIWRWSLACQWSRIGQEEPFVQRTHEVGDELGSRVLAARLVRDLMRLALLQSRVYAPYSKWLGTAFARLGHADGWIGALADVLAAGNYPDRERALTTAYRWWGSGTTRWRSRRLSIRSHGRSMIGRRWCSALSGSRLRVWRRSPMRGCWGCR